jgi:hypothetical protein
MKKSPKSQVQRRHNTKKFPKARVTKKQSQISRKQNTPMQRCPDCRTLLPNKARFCPRCGYMLAVTDESMHPIQDEAKATVTREAIKGSNKGQKAQTSSAVPQTPQPGEAQHTEGQKTPILPHSQDKPSPAENNDASGKTLLAPPPPPNTPVPASESGEKALPPSSPVKDTPLPPEALPIEEQKTRAFPARKKNAAPPSPKPQQIEEQRTILLPPSQKIPSNKRAEIEAQKTLAFPPEQQIPPAAQARALAEQKTQLLTKGQSTLPGTAGEKNARSGPTGTYPDAESYDKSARQTSDTAPRNKLSQTLPGVARPDISAKLPPPPPPALRRKVRKLIWPALALILMRAQDPEPEKAGRTRPHPNPLPWLSILVLSSALGLFTVATAYNVARENAPGAELFFWLGIGLIFLPTLIRLIHPQASRVERVSLLCVVALCLYLTKIALSPLYFTGFDELLHWRTVNDIMSTGHLFAKNPLLPVSPYYPGLEIVTSALSNISGLSTFQSGCIVVGVASLLMVLSLYLLCEQLSNSARLASIATIVYMANPHYLLFDHQFAYESLALPLATFVMFAMARYEMFNKSRPWVLLAAWLVLVAMDLTHHATNFVFEGLFLLWAAIYLFLRPLPLRKSIVIPTTILGLSLTIATVLLIGNTVISYFTSFFADVGSEIAQSLGSNGSGSRQLFSSAGAIPTPLWERLVPLGSVGLITLAIPLLLLCFWRRYRHNTLVWVFAVVAVGYPVLQVLRLTTSGAELSDRASAFIFIALSFLAAVAIVQFWPVRLLKWKQSIVISATILVLFMGGIILGSGIPPSFMPGPYEVSASARSIEPEGIQAALWARQHLGPNNRMYTDRINQLLMSAYGGQDLITKLGGNVDVTDVFFSSVVSTYEIGLLQKGQIHYLVVDMRLSQGLPQDGFYFEAGEPNANAEIKPMNPQYLTKFDTVPQINRLFDSGDIAIYDTGGLINTPKKP